MIGFIGFGNMGEAFAKAISREVTDNIVVFDKDPGRVWLAKEKYGFIIAKNLTELVEISEFVFVAVKPQNLDSVVDELRGVDFGSKVLVTMVAGVKSSYYLERLNLGRIVRIMPNVAVVVGEGAISCSFIGSFTEDERKRVIDLLSFAGSVVSVEENLIDAVTALSGSGPAFVATIIDAFVDAGVRVGLPREVSKKLTLTTFRGVLRMIDELGISPRSILEMVTSPGGTTIAGIHTLEKAGTRGIIMDTVFSAYERAKDLGK